MLFNKTSQSIAAFEEEQSEEEFADFNESSDYPSDYSEEDIENQYDHERSKYIYYCLL